MEVIKIKVHVSKDAAIAQGATEWGDKAIPLAPEIAAQVQAANDLTLTRCFLDETHHVSTPTLEAALKAAQGVCLARNHVVRELLKKAASVQNNIARYGFEGVISCTYAGELYQAAAIGRYGTPAQVAEFQALEKAWNDAKTAQYMEVYRESAARYFAGDCTLNGVVRAPSLIGIDPELDAKVNAHTQTLLATNRRLDALRETAIREIYRALVRVEYPEGSSVLQQFDEDQLRDSELLEMVAGWARIWILRGAGNVSKSKALKRIREDDLTRIKPTPTQYNMLREIEAVAREDRLLDAITKSLVRDVLVSARTQVKARLCNWSDAKNYDDRDDDDNPTVYQAIEVALTVESVTAEIQNGGTVEAAETWKVYFRLPSA